MLLAISGVRSSTSSRSYSGSSRSITKTTTSKPKTSTSKPSTQKQINQQKTTVINNNTT